MELVVQVVGVPYFYYKGKVWKSYEIELSGSCHLWDSLYFANIRGGAAKNADVFAGLFIQSEQCDLVGGYIHLDDGIYLVLRVDR